MRKLFLQTAIFFFLINQYLPLWAKNLQFSKAHSVLLKEIETINVNEDGSYTDIDEIFIKILDEKGRRQHQLQRFFLNKNYSKLYITKFEVIKPTGQVIAIDWRKNSKEVTPSSSSQMNIYDPNQKILTIFVPGLSKGDILHYVIKLDNFKPMIPGHFFGKAMLQQSFPIKLIKLTINMPKNKKLHYLIKNKTKKGKVNFCLEKTPKRYYYKWTVKDIPEFLPEPYMIDPSRVAMRLLFSTLSSWKQVSTWYYNLVEPKLSITSEIKKKVNELIKDKKGFKRKVEAIFFFVSRQIRYMGLIEESNRPGFEPHDVALTFNRRYGVCRDKAALLVAMLRVAGINAVPVIIKAGGKLDPEIPIPYFNHAIVAILDNNQKPLMFLDPTSETSTQFLPDYEQDSSCLLATLDGSELMLTPIKDPDRNLFLINITSHLKKDGSIDGTIEITALNFIDTAFRSILMSKSRDDQRRYLEEFFYKRNGGMKIIDLWWQNPSDRTKPFKIKCEYVIQHGLTEKRGFYPLSLSSPLGLIDNFVLSRASTIKRKYPLELKYTFHTIINEKLYLDFFYDNLLLPNLTDISNQYFSYLINFSLKQDCVEIKREFINRALELPASEYENLLKVQAEILKAQFIPLIIK